MVALIKTDAESITGAVSVCSDSNYNLTATDSERGAQNRRQNIS
jgi:hypothetical protein